MILSDLDNIAYNKFANGEITLAEYIKYENRDKILYKGLHGATKEDAEHYFPELKESEDDRIKREILELVSIAGNGNQFEEIKDWLEKQGEQKTLEMRGNQVISEVIKNQRDMPGEFTKLVHENFWDLIKTEHKMLDAKEVIEWLEDQACLGWIEDVEVHIFVDKFKKDFGLC